MLDILHRSIGRAVTLAADGAIYAGRGFRIFRSTDDGRSWQFITRIPCTMNRRLAASIRLGARLLRHEPRAVGVLGDGTLVASNREWVYYAPPGEPLMRRASVDEAGQPLFPPMCVTVGPNDRILWGEYDSRTAHGKPVRLYVSDDRGRSYYIARVFEGGSILHVHNLVWDANRRTYWLLAGDHNHEPGIGLLSEDLKSFEWLAKGKQEYRAVDVFDFGDRLVYGIDSEKEKNAIVSLDKNTARIERLVELEGSCIYSARFGKWFALSTTVEPSAVNRSRFATLWLSSDGAKWTQVLSVEKDRWHPRYFQYGSIVLPRGQSTRDTIVLSGQAIKGLDGRLVSARYPPHSEPRP